MPWETEITNGEHSIFMILDPLDHYNKHDPQRLIESLGHIPEWVAFYITLLDPKKDSLMEFLNKVYPYSIHESTGGELHPNGLYQFPGDPPMHPLCEIAVPEHGNLWQYPNAFVAIPTRDGNWFFTRMD